MICCLSFLVERCSNLSIFISGIAIASTHSESCSYCQSVYVQLYLQVRELLQAIWEVNHIHLGLLLHLIVVHKILFHVRDQDGGYHLYSRHRCIRIICAKYSRLKSEEWFSLQEWCLLIFGFIVFLQRQCRTVH